MSDFPDGAPPLSSPTDAARDRTGHNVAPDLSTIRAKAQRIVFLLSGTDGNGTLDETQRLSLAEELAQDISDLCLENGTAPVT